MMHLKHNTQQTLRGVLGVQDSLCSWGGGGDALPFSAEAGHQQRL